jgi:two-component system, NtrC family, response regulator HydG
MNKRSARVAPDAMDALQQHNWPGNVRELENAVERAMVVAQEPELLRHDFIIKPRANGVEPRTLEDMEKAHILRTLEQCSWNQTRAAEVLDIDRVTLHHKIKKYGWSKSPVEVR